MTAPSDRRGFLRGLVSLPLIGGGVTLIGRATAAHVPIRQALAAPDLMTPMERARYAWTAFSAAARELVPADAHGWIITGGGERRACGYMPDSRWINLKSIHYEIGTEPRCPRGMIEWHREIALGCNWSGPWNHDWPGVTG